jgi:hypothetical protein
VVARGQLPGPADDEGYLTYLGALVTWRAPLDGLFFQKFHPSLSVFMAPAAALGFRPFLVLHGLMAAAAVYMTGRIGRRMWGDAGWFAAALVALSPAFFIAGATGQSNSSGVFFLALAGYVYNQGDTRGRVAAGFIMGFALWVRFESAPYFVLLACWDLVLKRDLKLIAGLAAWPLAYVGVGALYHGTALWLLEYPPTLVVPNMPSTIPAVESARHFALQHAHRVLVALPFGWAIFRTRVAFLRDDRFVVLLGSLVAVMSLQTLLPLLGEYFNYDFATRYLLNHLVVAALAVTGLLLHWSDGSRLGALAAFACGVLVLILAAPEPARMLAAAPLLLVAVASIGRPQSAWVFMLVCGMIGFVSHAMSFESRSLRGDTEATEMYREAIGAAGGEEIWTNDYALRAWAERTGATSRVRFLPGYDILNELGTLVHRHHRQSRRLFEAFGDDLYGEPVWPCSYPRSISQGSVLLLESKQRTDLVHPTDHLIDSTTLLRTWPDREVTLHRVDRTFVAPHVETPPWMPAEVFEAPCESR